jgi:hypothetical protein
MNALASSIFGNRQYGSNCPFYLGEHRLHQSRLENALGVIASAAKQSGFLDCHGLNDRPRNDDPPFSKTHIFNAISITPFQVTTLAQSVFQFNHH